MRLRKSAIAEQDLLGIWEHVAQHNLEAADRLWHRLDDRFQLLLKSPQIGESQERFRRNLRSVIEGNYIIFYEPRPTEILIYRVLHAARKWEDLLS
jgi:toxin ParE1/3/4